MKVTNGQVMELNKALVSCHDLNNKRVEFRPQKNSNESVYEGKGSDGRTYYIEIQKPIMAKVTIVDNNK